MGTVYSDDLERGYKVSHCSKCGGPSVFEPCRLCREIAKDNPLWHEPFLFTEAEVVEASGLAMPEVST